MNLTVVCFIAAAGFGFGYYYWSNRMMRERKDGGQKVLGNPRNICFYPSLLTEQGLRARKWNFVCLCGFLLCVLAGLVFRKVLRGS